MLKDELEFRGPASVDFIPGCYVESEAKGPAIRKYRSLLEKSNTPFSPTQNSAAPARRLWNFLVRQELVQDVFIRAVFGKRKSVTTYLDSNSDSASNSMVDSSTPIPGLDNHSQHHAHHPPNVHVPEPVRVIHKEQESIHAFCINQVNPGMMALATGKEIQEMDIALLLESPNWMEDECEFDIMNLSKDIETLPASSFLVIQTAHDK
jgi:DmX-like protein